MAAKKKQKRDPNVPVLTFTLEGTRYEILIAGHNEFIPMAHKSGKYNWSDNSIIVRRWQNGLFEEETYLHDANFWGWIGRLIFDRTISTNGKNSQLLTLTDSPQFNDANGIQAAIDADNAERIARQQPKPATTETA